MLHVAAVEYTVSKLLRPQLEYLCEAGFEVRVACAPEGPSFSPSMARFRPVPLGFPRRADPTALLRAGVELRRLVADIGPAVVHFHSPAAAMPGRVALAAARRRPRVVYTVHGFLHTWDVPSARDRVLGRLERTISRFTDTLLFQSEEDLSKARAAGYASRLRYLGNGIGDEWFGAPPPRPAADGGSLHVAYVGRLTREKGVLQLLEAVGRLPDVRCTIVGDALATDRDGVRSEVAAAAAVSDGRIAWVGMVPPEEVRRHLSEAHVFVLPSRREGVPRSVIEAMALSLPVVATDIRGCRELVRPGVNGWLVQPRDGDDLAGALHAAASLPREELAAMGAAGRAIAFERHREAVVFDRLAEAYRELGVHPR